jgi:predicted house-cleaning noncanonical NTP pyrophosphatase (MazG superfamily)
MGAKLIRDNMADIPWRHETAKDSIRPVHDLGEHAALLVAKLLEEVGELLSATGNPKLACEEAADIEEVLFALMRLHDVHVVDIERARVRKRRERGGFDRGLVWET